jgi:hypothetical protein
MAKSKPTTNPPKPKGCTPISVTVAILTPDDKHQINFGITKGCNPDDTVFWIVDFLLKEQKGTQMVTRVEIHVHVGKDKAQDAANLANTRTLSPENVDLLNGPAADRAKAIPPGTTNDKKLNNLVLAAVSDN